MRLHKVVSGGQTGVDRAALDAAIECGIPIGGWCPRGRVAEDGAIAARYPLVETASSGYRTRTTWNVRDSDATLVLFLGALEGGTLFTTQVVAKLGKPILVLDLNRYGNADAISDFIDAGRLRSLNVAGPRESKVPGIHARALCVLVEAFGRDDRAARFVLR